jgi:glycine/D-amino acid oxidase-like deaminating enzyme
MEVNRAEAVGNWFQASWRPLCGYVCVLGLAVNFLISPIAAGFGFVVTPMQNRIRLAGIVDFSGLDSIDNIQRLELLKDNANKLFPYLSLTDLILGTGIVLPLLTPYL